MMINSFSFKNEFHQFFFRYLFVSLGLCWIFLLLLLWITAGAVIAAVIVLWLVLACFASSDD